MSATGEGNAAAVRRIQKELMNNEKEPLSDLHLVLDDNKTNLVHALIVGPEGTPYEGGFFYFLFTIPNNYPFTAPAVKLMTTGNGKVRFNPNLYACGKVCLSILGTWSGPAWTPQFTLRTVLLSIQSLLNAKPYYNEPGYGTEKGASAETKLKAEEYNENIRFETTRVAVIETMEKKDGGVNMPKKLREIIVPIFKSKIDFYSAVILQNEESKKHDYAGLQKRLKKLIDLHLGSTEEDGKTGNKRGSSKTKPETETTSSGSKPPKRGKL